MAGEPQLLTDLVLEAPLGAGGMGVVWRGRRLSDGLPVAIKALAASRLEDDNWMQAFHREVRAVASLDHPGVIAILDQGRVGAELCRTSSGALPEGAPALVMELALGGSLAPLLGRLDWARCRALLEQVLQALAAAHARGIVHRDVKPSNVLLLGPEPGQGAARLADFGLAWEQVPGEVLAGWGTPAWMAPEAFDPEPPGPAADLYAMGCLAMALVQGGPPWAVRDPAEAALLHRQAPVPALRPRIPVPRDLERWIRRLLCKRPAERFACAADARAALADLGPVEGAAWRPAQAVASDPTLTSSVIETLDPQPLRGGEPERLERRPAPPPASGREDARLVGRPVPGPRLAGLRPPPLVGREAEQDRLWELLLAVHHQRRPRRVVLSGPAGIGRSRLGSWLGERAAETGTALLLQARHGPVPGPQDGPLAMLARFHRVAGRDLAGIHKALRDLSPPREGPEARALARLLHQPESPLDEEAMALVLAEIGRICQERPAVLWMDDVQWGTESLRLAERLQDSELPVLILLGQRTGEGRGPGEGPEILDLEPLRPEATARLVAALLGRRNPLSIRIEERSAGNPQFAVALVAELSRQGALSAGLDGLEARQELSLPADLEAAWAERVEQMLADLDPPGLSALERAAALGLEVEIRSWTAACAIDGIACPDSLLDRLEQGGLVEVLPGGSFRIHHAVLREVLLERARTGGRLPAHHAACARVLGNADPERTGQHLLLAGDIDAAAPFFEQAAALALDLGRHMQALALLDRWTAEPTPGLVLLRAEVLAITVPADPSLEPMLLRLLADPLPPRVKVAARVLLARRLDRLGQLAAGRDAFQELEPQVRELGDPSLLGDWHYGIAWPLLRLGVAATAATHLEKAGHAWARAGRQHAVLRAELARATVLCRGGALEEAEVAARRAWEQAERAGRISAGISAANCLGEIARERRQHDEAIRWYDASIALHNLIRPGTSPLAAGNLGVVLVEQGRPAEARPYIQTTIARQHGIGNRLIANSGRAWLSRCAIQEGHRDELGALLEEIRQTIAETGQVEAELAQALEAAARDAGARGWMEEQALLLALARDQRQRME